jgi:hypothetical protein
MRCEIWDMGCERRDFIPHRTSHIIDLSQFKTFGYEPNKLRKKYHVC